MEIYIQKQLIIILYSLLVGLIFGAGYDIIRIIHIMLGKVWFRRPVIFLLDLVYMLILTCCYSVFTYAFNNGMYRMFIEIPMIVGFIVYYNTIGRVVIYFSEVIIRFIRTVIHYVIVVPLRFLWRMTRCAFIWIYRHTLYILFQKIADLRRLIYTARQRKLIKKLVRI